MPLGVGASLELPEGEWETYEKGQHLRGADAVFADQVLDELVCCSPPTYQLSQKQSDFMSPYTASFLLQVLPQWQYELLALIAHRHENGAQDCGQNL